MRVAALIVAAAALAGCGEAEERRAAPRPVAPLQEPPRVRARPAPVATPAVPAAARRAAAALAIEERVARVFLAGVDGPEPVRAWGAVLLEPEDVAVGLADPESAPPLVVATEPRPEAQLLLGPSADVPIGEEPDAVVAALRRELRASAVPLAPGHFPGQGAATQDPLDGPSVVGLPLELLRERDLAPWRAIAGRVPAVVVSSAAFTAFDPVTPAALNPDVVGGLLRGEIGFSGAAVTDDLAGAAAVGATSIGTAAVSALRAGSDLLQVRDPVEAEAAYEAVLAAVRSGEVPAGRLTEAAARVLALASAVSGA